MEDGEATAGQATRPAWNPFSKKPLARWRAAGFAMLLASLIVGFFSQAVHDAWIAITWQRVTAAVAGEARQKYTGRGGPRYDAPLMATLSDGRRLSGRPIRPFPTWTSSHDDGGTPVPAGPPQPGYELAVRLDPADPRRMLPEATMVHSIPAQAAINLIVVGVVARLLFQLFRGERPRLSIPTELDGERARANLRAARDRPSVGAPRRGSL